MEFDTRRGDYVMGNKRLLSRIKKLEQAANSKGKLERVNQINETINALEGQIEQLKKERLDLLGVKPPRKFNYYQSHPEHIGNLLNNRLANALVRGGITTVAQLHSYIEQHGKEALLAIHNVGEKGLCEVEEKLGI